MHIATLKRHNVLPSEPPINGHPYAYALRPGQLGVACGATRAATWPMLRAIARDACHLGLRTHYVSDRHDVRELAARVAPAVGAGYLSVDALGDGETCGDAVARLAEAVPGQVLVLDLALLHRVVPALLQLAERHQMRVWAQVEDVPPTADLAWFEAAGWGRASCILGIAPDPSDRTVD